MSDKSAFLRAGASSLFVRAVGAAAQLGFSVVVARSTGASGAGAFFIALAPVTLGSVLARGGLDSIVVREVARSRATGAERSASATAHAAIAFTLGASLILAGLILAAATPLAHLLTETPISATLRRMALALPGMAATAISAEILRANGRVIASQVIATILTPLLTATVMMLPGTTWRGESASALYAIVCTAVASLGVALSLRPEKSVSAAATAAHLPRLLASGRPLLGLAILDATMSWFGIYALGRLYSAEGAGVFAVATRLAGIPAYALVAANLWLAPKMAALNANGRLAELGQLFRYATRAITLLAVPVTVTIAVLARVILDYYGPGFSSGTLAAQVMLAGQLINVAVGPAGNVLIMSGHERTFRSIVVLAALANLTTSLVLVPSYGVLGAGIGTATGVLTQNALAAFWAHRLVLSQARPTNEP